MSDWIRTKAGLQMAETSVRQLPRLTTFLQGIDNHNIKIEEIEERLFSSNKTMVKYLPRITVALEGIAESLKLKWSEQEILRLAEEEQSNFEGKSTKNS